MDRLISAANFIHNNMPVGTTRQQPVLSVEDSRDVAAFVLSQPRPQKAHLDRDFPVRTEKPAEAAYGPYIDGFSREQHTLGPFLPIEKKLAALKAANPDHIPGRN
jgi:thiosulfate dehydrogenase